MARTCRSGSVASARASASCATAPRSPAVAGRGRGRTGAWRDPGSARAVERPPQAPHGHVRRAARQRVERRRPQALGDGRGARGRQRLEVDGDRVERRTGCLQDPAARRWASSRCGPGQPGVERVADDGMREGDRVVGGEDVDPHELVRDAGSGGLRRRRRSPRRPRAGRRRRGPPAPRRPWAPRARPPRPGARCAPERRDRRRAHDVRVPRSGPAVVSSSSRRYSGLPALASKYGAAQVVPGARELLADDRADGVPAQRTQQDPLGLGRCRSASSSDAEAPGSAGRSAAISATGSSARRRAR